MVYKKIEINEYIQNYNLKSLDKKDLPKLVSLFEFVMKKRWDENYWNWFLYQNPYKTYSLTLWDKDKLIGCNCALKKILLINQKECDCILVSTAIVHDDYRRQGIYTYIVKRLYNKLSELGYLLIYGFPNKNYDCRLYSKTRISWNYCDKKNLLIKDIRKKSRLNKKIKPTFNFSISNVNRFPEEANSFELKKKKGILIKKNMKYLNWRYVDNPINEYDQFLIYDKTEKIIGFFVLKTFKNDKGEKFGEIDDFGINNDNLQIFSEMYQFILEYFIDKNNDYISTWVGENSKYFTFLLRNKFRELEMPTSWGFKILQKLNHNKKTIILNSKNWDLRMGDSDVF